MLRLYCTCVSRGTLFRPTTPSHPCNPSFLLFLLNEIIAAQGGSIRKTLKPLGSGLLGSNKHEAHSDPEDAIHDQIYVTIINKSGEIFF